MDLHTRIIIIIVAWVILVTQVFSMPVYADYEPDDDFFAFMLEYVKQRNLGSQLMGYYDQYKKTGLSAETAWEIAKHYVSSNYTAQQAGLEAIKTTYRNFTSSDQSKLIDFYNKVNVYTR